MHTDDAVRPYSPAKRKSKSEHLGLRIRRRYMHDIRDGKQHVEIRAFTDFYHRMFADKTRYRTVTFHYQQSERLTCDIASIRVIKRPSKSIVETDHVYAIELRNPRSWYKKTS